MYCLWISLDLFFIPFLHFPANYLLCQSEQDDPETGDFEYVELMEHGLTPFTALFDEEENMQVMVKNYTLH